MSPLLWGIAGAGKISHDFVSAIQSFPQRHKVIAIGSNDQKKAENFAKDHNNIPKAYGNYENIAKDPEIQVVYIGNLNTQHYATAKLMLEHRKAVLCEKPFTMNEKQTKKLVEIAKTNNVFLMEAIWSRCFPAYDKARELIENGAIGLVKFISINFGHSMQNKQRIIDKKLGGGAILDLGVYSLQFQQFFYRSLKQTSMVVCGTLTKDGVDGTTAAIIGYEDGQIASISCSSEVKMPNEGIIVGTKGTIKLPSFWCPTQLIINQEEPMTFELPVGQRRVEELNRPGLLYEADEVKRCIEEGRIESTLVPLQETIELAKMMDKMREHVGLCFPEDY